jgi:anthranilate phosphoribosyltransferase
MTVNSQEGLDEISVSAPTNVCEYRQGQFSRYVISPQDYGINSGSLDDVRGGDAVENAEIIRNILEGKLKGAKRDIVLLNSGAALYIAGKAQSIKEGLRKAADVIDNGSAFRKLEEYCKLSNSMKEMAK